MNKQQDGFAHAVLIIGLVVAILGALGFIFWQNFIYQAPETKTVTVKTVKKHAPTGDMSRMDELTLKDYNVSFTLQEPLNDTTVKYETRQVGDGPSYIAFTTQRVVDLGGDCSKGYPFGDIVTLTRNTTAVPSKTDVYTSKQIGDYYYHVGTVETAEVTPASTCTSNEKAKADMNQLVNALKTIRE